MFVDEIGMPRRHPDPCAHRRHARRDRTLFTFSYSLIVYHIIDNKSRVQRPRICETAIGVATSLHMTTTASPAEPKERHAGLARVDVRHCDELSYEAFVTEYMTPLKPVLIEGVARGWRSMEEWVCPSDGSIDLDFLAARFGESEVCITDTSGTDGYGEGASRIMRLSDYVHWWRTRDSCGDQAGGAGSESLYVKDWHFAAEHPKYQVSKSDKTVGISLFQE